MIRRDTLEYLPCTKLKDIKYVSIEWCEELDSRAAAVRCIQDMCAMGYSQFLVVCNNSDDANEWYAKMKQMKMPDNRLEDIVVVPYAGLAYYVHTIFSLIILDRLDESKDLIDWDLFGRIYTCNVYNKPKVVSVSKPNLPTYVKNKIERYTSSSFTTYYTYNLAVAEGLLAKAKIHLIPISLSQVERECTYNIKRGIIDKRIHINVDYKDCQPYLDTDKYPNLDMTMMCSVKERYLIYSSGIEVRKKMAEDAQTKAALSKWLQLKNERLSFISEQKKPFIYTFLHSKYMREKPFIYLGSTIRECFQMGAEKATAPKNKYNADILRSFNNGELKGLFAVGSLLEGINYNIAKAIVISQLDSRIKEVFESLRLPLREEDPDIFIFYCRNTRDEEYISSILKSVDKSCIDTVSPHEACTLQSTPESSEIED